jgi:hypothetical protein
LEITGANVAQVVTALGGTAGVLAGIKAFFAWLVEKDAKIDGARKEAIELAGVTTTKVEGLFNKLGEILDRQHVSNDAVCDRLTELGTEVRALATELREFRSRLDRSEGTR